MVPFHQDYYPGGTFADQGDRIGHEIVATIAEVRLEKTVLPTLCSILNPNATNPEALCSLASVASWADVIKDEKPWSAPMHYVGTHGEDPPESCNFPGKGGWVNKDTNVLTAIRKNVDILDKWVKDGRKPGDSNTSDALKFLIHFVGDVHQPFHTVARLRGANGIFVKWGGERTSESFSFQPSVEYDLTFEVGLHTLWDRHLVERAIDETPSDYRKQLAPKIEKHLHGNEYDPLIRKILVEGIEKKWAREVESWIKCPVIDPPPPGGDPDGQIVIRSNWQDSNGDTRSVCPWGWATPIHKLTCKWIWPKEVDEGKPLVQLDADWYGGRITREWVVERFLAMGGLRLAAILNSVFAPSHVPDDCE